MVYLSRIRLMTGIASLVTLSAQALACPSFVTIDEVWQAGMRDPQRPPNGRPGDDEPRRADLRLFTLATEGDRTAWRELPLQIEPLGKEGILDDEEDLTRALEKPWASGDRLSFERHDFGVRRGDQALPCQASQAIEVKALAASDQYGYLVACPGAKPLAPKERVTFSPERHLIASPLFSYQFHPTNQLMYQQMEVTHPQSGVRTKAGSDAQILVRLDLKRFFTMNFDNDDLESYVEATNVGPWGVVNRIDFFLRVLFIKINLRMTTTASFYENSANIPMLVDVPRNGPDVLNPGSGLLYSWIKDDLMLNIGDDPHSIPVVDPEAIRQGPATLAKIGLKRCEGETCRFDLNGKVGERPVRISFMIPRFLVAAGMFPMWISDVRDFKKAMAWDDDEKDAGRIAIYFENSGLPKGTHRLDHWIQVGKIEAACPSPVELGHIKSGGAVKG